MAVGASALPRDFDPASATDVRALRALWLVYTPLVSYRHAEGPDGTGLVPGLARALPEVSDDGLTYTLRLRRGLRYSSGVPVRPGDFERAVNRVRALRSPLARLYAGIASIDADARTRTIRMTLRRRDPAFADVLALPSSAPLPRGTPAKDLSGRPPAGVGPYRFARVRPGSRAILVRVRDFSLPDIPAGHVDRIALIRAGSPRHQARAVIIGSLDLTQETAPIDMLPEIRSKYRDRYREDPTASSVALIPDTALPPLDDTAVRRAVGESLDGETLVRLYKGLLESSCNFLPAAVAGYRRLDPCPYGDRSEPPDLVGAQKRLKEAAVADTGVSVLPGAGVPQAVARYVVRTLRTVGLRATLRGRGQAVLRVARIEPLVAHPAVFLTRFVHTTFDPTLSQAVADGTAVPTGGERADDAWASADERVVKEGYAVPLGSERRPTFLSERLDAANCARVHPVFGIDFSSLCLK